MPKSNLEKNQEEFYEDVVAIYTVEVSGGGAESVKGPEIKALKPGIRLHFLRYGLFDRNSDFETKNDVYAPEYQYSSLKTQGVLIKDDQAVCAPIDGNSIDSKTTTENEQENQVDIKEVEIIALKELPSLENFYVARTALNQGYIYLINDEDQDDYHEIYVNETGQLKHILWGYSKDKKGNYLDVRQPSGKASDYKLVKSGKKYWVGYSPVQWSRDYHYSLNTDVEKRKARMKLIDCSGIKKGEEETHKNAIPFINVHAVFPANHPRAGALNSMLHSILADEKKQDEKGDNELYEDMFITLDDPAGCATDIANVLTDKVFNLQALVESLGSGKDPKDIKDRILRGEEKPDIRKGSEEEQIATLLSTALTTYQLVYNDTSMINDYDGGEDEDSWNQFKFKGWVATPMTMGVTPIFDWDGNGIYKQKLIDILAVKERKKIRKKIIHYRKDFVSILGSDYYTKYFQDFRENGFLGLLEGKTLCIQHAKLLAVSPESIDGYLDLKKDRGNYSPELKQKNKEANEFFASFLINRSTPVHELLDEELDLVYLDENEGVLGAALITDLANKTASHISESVEAYVALAKVTKSNIELPFNRLKKFTYKGKLVYQVRKKTLEALLKSEGVTLDRSKVKFIGHKNGHKLVLIKDIDEIFLLDEYNPKGSNTLKNVPVESIPKKTVAQVKGAQRIFNSVHFAKGLYYLQILNISSATYQVVENGSYKSLANLGGISFELTGALYNLKRAQAIANMASKESVNFFSSRSKLLGTIGAGFTAAVCIWEAVDAFRDNDNDAMFLWAGAGALFTTGIFVTGPVGWVIGGVAIGLVYLANYFKDKPLEKYFKHYWLSDKMALPRSSNEQPWQYINRVYKNREDLIKDREEYKSWKDLRVCHQQLLDLMVCRNMFVYNFKLRKSNFHSFGGYERAGISIEISEIAEFTIETSFRQFLWHSGQYKYQVFIVNNKSNTYEEIPFDELKGVTQLVKDDSKRAVATRTTISIPTWVHDKALYNVRKNMAFTQIVFMCRLLIDEDSQKYYPHTYVGEDRYMGIKLELKDVKITGIQNMDGLIFPLKPTEYKDYYYKNVRIDTFDGLLQWGKTIDEI